MSGDSNTFFILNLGCAKNAVDSESIAQILTRAGFRRVSSPGEAETLIVNTCGFIEAAKQESVEALRRLAAGKRPGQLLIAAGCLSQRSGPLLAGEVPGLDGLIGTRRWMDILHLIRRLHRREQPDLLYHLPGEALTVGTDEQGVLRAAVQGASAYLKIADGCRRPCAFCTIPLIKGTHVSRPPDVILAEAARLDEMGVREIILISQDTTDYGHDLGMKDGLPTLLEQLLVAAPGVPWIRILYTYPGCVSERLIEVMATHERILPYLDMPLQHSHREVLKRMRRPANIEWACETIARMRAAMPRLAIRTTFIVGYPGETDQEFETLVDFVREMCFDHVGVFTYSCEADTPGAGLPNQIPEEVKTARRDYLMAVQQDISYRRNRSFIGQTLDILVEGYGDGLSVGRSYRDAPEVDGLVLVEDHLPPGEIVPVHITGAMPYDLIGTIRDGSPIVLPGSTGVHEVGT